MTIYHKVCRLHDFSGVLLKKSLAGMVEIYGLSKSYKPIVWHHVQRNWASTIALEEAVLRPRRRREEDEGYQSVDTQGFPGNSTLPSIDGINVYIPGCFESMH